MPEANPCDPLVLLRAIVAQLEAAQSPPPPPPPPPAPSEPLVIPPLAVELLAGIESDLDAVVEYADSAESNVEDASREDEVEVDTSELYPLLEEFEGALHDLNDLLSRIRSVAECLPGKFNGSRSVENAGRNARDASACARDVRQSLKSLRTLLKV